MQGMRVQSLGQEGPLEKEMATHSSILAWEIPWIEEPGGYRPWGHKSDMNEQLNNDKFTYLFNPLICNQSPNPATKDSSFVATTWATNTGRDSGSGFDSVTP